VLNDALVEGMRIVGIDFVPEVPLAADSMNGGTEILRPLLPKAARYVGIALLMKRLGIDHVDRIRLRGVRQSDRRQIRDHSWMISDCDLGLGGK
jgi:hypothetical protein